MDHNSELKSQIWGKSVLNWLGYNYFQNSQTLPNPFSERSVSYSERKNIKDGHQTYNENKHIYNYILSKSNE